MSAPAIKAAAHHDDQRPMPVGGPILTRPFLVLLALFVVALGLLAYRFVAGLGAVTAMNDGHPWGLWIAYDVLIGTALACGGYAVALLVYAGNNWKYHPLVRPALVTSALGYSLAGASVVIDLGRWWNVWKVPLFWGDYNFNSVLLEVALCIMGYTLVLWIELSPAFLERWESSKRPWLARLSKGIRPRLEKALLWIIALGMLLPTMHQSSLGSLFLIAGKKVHPLWHTPLLPALFLLSCIAMGYAAVVLESGISSRLLRRKADTAMLGSLAVPAMIVTAAYLVLRLGDLALRGKLPLAFTAGGKSVLFWLEIALFAAPVLLLLSRQRRGNLGALFRAALLLVVAGATYRFSTSLVAFDPGNGWTYFPSVGEILVTTGLVAFEVLAYVFLIKTFPILAGKTPPRPVRQPARVGMPVPATAAVK